MVRRTARKPRAPVDDGRGARVGVVLPGKMLARLDAMVDVENGEDRSDVIRRALADLLRKGTDGR